jgi:hypothetical protein
MRVECVIAHSTRSEVGWVVLLVVAFDQLSFEGYEIAEEATGLVIGAGSEVEFTGGRFVRIVAAKGSGVCVLDRPESVDGEDSADGVSHLTLELTGDRVEDCDGPAVFCRAGAGKLSDEQFMAVEAEVLRGKGDSPWHVEEVSVLKALDESTVRAIDVDVAEAGTGDPMTVLCQGIGNDDVVANGLDIERCEVVGELGVSERGWSVALIQVYGAEGVVKDIDAGFGVVGDVEEMPAVYEGAGEAGEYGAVSGFDGNDGVGGWGVGPGSNGHGWIPGGDGSVDRDKEEQSWFT